MLRRWYHQRTEADMPNENGTFTFMERRMWAAGYNAAVAAFNAELIENLRQENPKDT